MNPPLDLCNNALGKLKIPYSQIEYLFDFDKYKKFSGK